jgi:hypothetical protein
MRVGVDLNRRAAVVYWASLHITARRRLLAEGRDPDTIELIQGVQLSGRILRPIDAWGDRIVVFIDGRFYKHIDYLENYFEVLELPHNL